MAKPKAAKPAVKAPAKVKVEPPIHPRGRALLLKSMTLLSEAKMLMGPAVDWAKLSLIDLEHGSVFTAVELAHDALSVAGRTLTRALGAAGVPRNIDLAAQKKGWDRADKMLDTWEHADPDKPRARKKRTKPTRGAK